MLIRSDRLPTCEFLTTDFQALAEHQVNRCPVKPPWRYNLPQEAGAEALMSKLFLILFFLFSWSQPPIIIGFCDWHSNQWPEGVVDHWFIIQRCTVKTSKAFRTTLKTKAAIRFTYGCFVPWEIQSAFPTARVSSAPDQQEKFIAGWVLFSSKMKGLWWFLPEEGFRLHNYVLEVSYNSTSNPKFELQFKEMFFNVSPFN